MPSPQPLGALKRPPLLTKGSSFSSLSGMEQAVPSFESFVRRTPPPPDQAKPLPPTPLIPRRVSSASPSRSRTTSLYGQRRSSSIYSRTVSQWFDDDCSWRSADLRDGPLPDMPPLPFLQPVAYSKSTPQLHERLAAPPRTLGPRTSSPLIVTPSPTASRVTTPEESPARSPGPSPLGQDRQQQQSTSATYDTPLHLRDATAKQVQTVSLEQAKAALHFPGAVHLLPEELRAQRYVRSRSHEPIRVPTMAFFDQALPKAAPPLPVTLIDAQERHRSLQARLLDVGSEYLFPTTYPSEKAPLQAQHRDASRAKAAEPLGLADDDQPRGRTRQREPRSTDYSRYMPRGRRAASSPSPDDERKDAQKVASEYHRLLSEQHRQPPISPAYNSDDSIRAHMKMVPQPLFKSKPAAHPPRAGNTQGSERGSNASESPFHRRADSPASHVSSGTPGSPSLRLSTAPGSTHHRSSTSGSIPISPPTNVPSASPAFTRKPASSKETPPISRSRRRSEEDRVSMYYPYVGSRKVKKAKDKKAASDSEGPVPPMPLLSADIIAQRLGTPDGSTESSPLRGTAPANFTDNSSNRKGSNADSDRQRTPLSQRLAGNAVRYADLISRPSGLPEAQNHHHSRPSDSTIALAHSPHLLPSPVKSKPPPVHLGWSENAKSTFDRSRSGMHSSSHASQRSAQLTQLTHLPARPLDESRLGLSEPEGRGPKQSSSIFGGLLDGWKERKKEEKREELKKIIKVVPQLPPPQMHTMDIVRSGGGDGLVRQASEGPGVGRVAGARPVSGGLSRSMSAFGWM